MLTRAIELGPRAVATKLALRTTRALRRGTLRWRDGRRPSYEPAVAGARLRSRLAALELAPIDLPDRLVEAALDHRFDLLGSGDVRVAHGIACPGVEGMRYPPGPAVAADAEGHWLAREVDPCNLARAGQIWRLVSPGYVPIDWQLDFKSGYRWSARTWSADIVFGVLPGADIKLPLELARLQHLPLLALAFRRAQDPALAMAFRDQALDFLAANPPRFGVNWTIPMDVAIRLVNLLLAWDLFVAQGMAFDAPFEAELAAAVVAHGRFLAQNLEWQPDYRGNHYLADLVGLLFAAAYLPADAASRRWLDFAAGELVAETARQFLPDGASHELSTCYHRLAGELVAWGTAIILGEGRSLPPSHATALVGIGAFLHDSTAPDGLLIQIGDNDDGRLVKLGAAPIRESGELADVLSALLRAKPLGAAGTVAAALAGARRLPAGAAPMVAAPPLAGLPAAPDGARVRRFAARSGGARPQLAWYPDVGLAVWRADWLFLAVVCRRAPVPWPGAHAHNDQLALELWLDRQPVIRDPGSYLYTADPVWRDRYRSVAAHDAPWLQDSGEPAAFRGIFARDGGPVAELLHCGPDGLHGRLLPPAPAIHRAVVIEPDAVQILDWVEGDPAPRWLSPEPLDHSPGYGIRMPVSPAEQRLP